ncbi:demethylmenaquinone methyltransferase / 2-methoxy-6-polyprenyl-1,4-benzoquinol methylase [Saccharopolyspora flava]|uniref:Demethylmenaquinone methyltransferase / 2-methoxy-6-polyprenyl-1,4-benzoquinol methylase n=1 Tax=Saccharopolyspora flava TaxID=95161 RepID=A0A1I6SV71_9PSEU|nr:demethylmenaquinone methyltransferase / 2-methoxy-6-polyprenyl-1,4-benzoquinol methylase [Saccharopolyspora flava]
MGEQAAYYRAVAGEYGDYGALPGVSELGEVVEAFGPSGRVLELACGPGVWTPLLARHADEVTAVDASAEMLERAAARVGDGVRFVQADVFGWRPTGRFDVVFFGFWLSHVPPERFAAFWSGVAECLVPGGRVLFVDDALRPAEELVEGAESVVVRRRAGEAAHRVVKVGYRPAELEARLAGVGWSVRVRETVWPFYWGAGSPV